MAAVMLHEGRARLIVKEKYDLDVFEAFPLGNCRSLCVAGKIHVECPVLHWLKCSCVFLFRQYVMIKCNLFLPSSLAMAPEGIALWKHVEESAEVVSSHATLSRMS